MFISFRFRFDLAPRFRSEEVRSGEREIDGRSGRSKYDFDMRVSAIAMARIDMCKNWSATIER
jgi:hypothetical protein